MHFCHRLLNIKKRKKKETDASNFKRLCPISTGLIGASVAYVAVDVLVMFNVRLERLG